MTRSPRQTFDLHVLGLRVEVVADVTIESPGAYYPGCNDIDVVEAHFLDPRGHRRASAATWAERYEDEIREAVLSEMDR